MKSLGAWRSQSAPMELLKQCREAVRAVAPDATLVLYGSRARGDSRPESDLDLLILVDGPPTVVEDRIRDVLYPIELESGIALSLFVESRTKWDSAVYRAMPFVRAVEAEGVVL